ncbi:hypothetical protein [Veronia nyctiphanis]|nr:hypothetical protein [Veronia nyctiphanis]
MLKDRDKQNNEEALNQEALAIERMITSKKVLRVFRPRSNEICLEFDDGTRLFIDGQLGETLEFSVTGS